MKTQIYSHLQIKDTQNFIDNIAKFIDRPYKEVYIMDFVMKRAGGYGSYNYELKIELDGWTLHILTHTNDSMVWDWYQDCEHNKTYEDWVKSHVLELLELSYNSGAIRDIFDNVLPE